MYGEFTGKKDFGMTIQRRQFPLKGSFRTVKKVTGLRALYLHYCYLLGVIEKNKPQKPLSPEMREAWRFLDRYSQQVQLIAKQKLHDLPAVEAFIGKSEEEIKLLTDYRKALYRKIDRCRDPEEKAALISKRNDCTAVLAELRRDVKTAGRLIEDNPKIKENIRIEERMRQEIYAPKKQRKRDYER